MYLNGWSKLGTEHRLRFDQLLPCSHRNQKWYGESSYDLLIGPNCSACDVPFIYNIARPTTRRPRVPTSFSSESQSVMRANPNEPVREIRCAVDRNEQEIT